MSNICENPECLNIKRYNKYKKIYYKTCSDKCRYIIANKNKKFKLQYYDSAYLESYIDDKIFDFKKLSIDLNISIRSARQHIKRLNLDIENKKQFSKISLDKILTYLNKDNTINFNKIKKEFKIGHSQILKVFHSHNIEFKTNRFDIINYELYFNKEFIEKKFINKEKNFLLNEFCTFFNVLSNAAYLKLNELDIKYQKNVQTSYNERQIVHYIKSLNIKKDIKLNDRSFGKEMDILIDNIGIEYNGLIYHSHGKSQYTMLNNPNDDKNRHLKKTQLCEDNNINLLQIFENEWNDPIKNEIWKSVISYKLGISNKIGARKCIIKEISSIDKKQFLIENHLQGNCNSSINIGLFYNNNLVSIMTFSKSRYNKKTEFELLRFCNKRFLTIQGGFSKLLNYFEKKYNNPIIISYANRRWSDGNLYEINNFKLQYNTPPNYFYFKLNKNILYSRLKFQKHKLAKILEVFDENQTETENMYNNDYRKIYDSGNKVYIKNKKDK